MCRSTPTDVPCYLDQHLHMSARFRCVTSLDANSVANDWNSLLARGQCPGSGGTTRSRSQPDETLTARSKVDCDPQLVIGGVSDRHGHTQTGHRPTLDGTVSECGNDNTGTTRIGFARGLPGGSLEFRVRSTDFRRRASERRHQRCLSWY